MLAFGLVFPVEVHGTPLVQPPGGVPVAPWSPLALGLSFDEATASPALGRTQHPSPPSLLPLSPIPGVMVEPRDSPLSPGRLTNVVDGAPSAPRTVWGRTPHPGLSCGAGSASGVSSSGSGGSLLQRMAAAVAAQHQLANCTGTPVTGTLITPANGESLPAGPRRVVPIQI